ncbi:cytochrome P450 [Mycena crocata]|nr:cytochrome P450 [Mycena crocata]
MFHHSGWQFQSTPKQPNVDIFARFKPVIVEERILELRTPLDPLSGRKRVETGLWIFDAWSFFTKRYDFLTETFRRSGKKFFRFRVLQHRVLASSGLDARKAFLTEKSLNLGEGYKILLGGGPDLADIKVDTEGLDEEGHFMKRLFSITTKDRLQDVPVLASFVGDINKPMVAWGPAGPVDPFAEIYKIVFQITVRMSTCKELADDPAAVSVLSDLYWLLEKGTTPVGVLLPWFPSPARKAREKATAHLFGMLYKYVEIRRNAAVPSSDAFDLLISQGMATQVIVGFVLRVIFAGVINTAVNACWAVLYVNTNPEWKAKATAEIRALLVKHSSGSTDALHTRLASIPLTVWEEETPVIDAVLRETLRLVMGGVALRRNLAPSELSVGSESLARGEFLAYSLADVHLDPSIYPDPQRFDPGRYDAGREEDKRAPYGYLGWGAGRHPCAGMKIAKLEMKLVLAMFLAGFEYQIVDLAGKPLSAVPQIDRNDILMPRPLKPCNIKFKRTEK